MNRAAPEPAGHGVAARDTVVRRGPAPYYRWIAGTSLALTLSCASPEQIRLPPEFPFLRLDEAASELLVENATNADELKAIIIDALRENLESSSNSEDLRDARIRGHAKVFAHTHWLLAVASFVPGGLILAFSWAPIGYVEVDLALEIDAEGERYVGRGVAESDQLLQSSVSDLYLRRATRIAAGRALADAAANGPVNEVDP